MGVVFIFLFFSVITVIMLISRFGKDNAVVKILIENKIITGFGAGNNVIEAGGWQIVYAYHAGSKNNPSRLSLTLTGNFSAHAVFRAETGVDRFGKSIGLNQEVQLYDPAFDSAVYVECDDPEFVGRFLNSSEAKERLRDAFKFFTSLEIDDNRLILTKTPCPEYIGMDSEIVMNAAKSMACWAGNIPLPAPGQASLTPVTDEWRSLGNFFMAFAVILLVTGIGLMLWGFTGYPPLYPGKVFMASLKLSVPLFLGLAVYVFNALKGSSIALRFLTGVVLFGAAGMLVFCWGGIMVVNGSQDVSSKVAHHSSVMQKYITHSKNSTSYHIRLMPWTNDGPDYGYTVSWSEYGRIKEGDPCVVDTRSGLFKFEWITRHQCGANVRLE